MNGHDGGPRLVTPRLERPVGLRIIAMLRTGDEQTNKIGKSSSHAAALRLACPKPIAPEVVTYVVGEAFLFGRWGLGTLEERLTGQLR